MTDAVHRTYWRPRHEYCRDCLLYRGGPADRGGASKSGSHEQGIAAAALVIDPAEDAGAFDMTIRDQILQAANEIAGRMQADLFDFDRQLSEAKKRVVKIKKECDAARGAPERLSNFPIQLGGDYLCPRCWIEEGRRSPLYSLPTNTGEDLLRCGLCKFELLISH